MSPYLTHKNAAVVGSSDYFMEIERTQQPNQPLIIGLHGYGSDERQMESLVALDVSVPHTYITLRAYDELDAGGYGWYPVRFDKDIQPVIDPTNVLDALTRAAAFITQAAGMYKTSSENVYVVGFSMGGSMSAMLALLHPEVAAGFAVLAGTIHSEVQPYAARGQHANHVFIGHGILDPLISREESEALAQVLKNRGRVVEHHSYNIPHVVGQQERIDLSRWLENCISHSQAIAHRKTTP